MKLGNGVCIYQEVGVVVYNINPVQFSRHFKMKTSDKINDSVSLSIKILTYLPNL